MEINPDPKRIGQWCDLPKDKLWEVAQERGAVIVDDPTGRRYAYLDRGGDILCVAHVDVVSSFTDWVSCKGKNNVKYWKPVRGGGSPPRAEVTRRRVTSIGLDDRLGVYLAMDLLPALKVKCDVLLTDDEECGASTGGLFQIPEGKQYKWMFSFDRTGHDVVMYDYDNDGYEGWEKLFLDLGIYLGSGSFSDISSMEHLGIKGFNFGCGYYHAHSKDCTVSMKELRRCVRQFLRFHAMYKDMEWKHTPSPYSGGYGYYGGYGSWNRKSLYTQSYSQYLVGVCDVCGRHLDPEDEPHYKQGLCTGCYNRYFTISEEGTCKMCGTPIDPNTGSCPEECWEEEYWQYAEDREVEPPVFGEGLKSAEQCLQEAFANQLGDVSDEEVDAVWDLLYQGLDLECGSDHGAVTARELGIYRRYVRPVLFGEQE